MRRLVPATLLIALAWTPSHAELYKRVDEQGNVTYGDQPGEKAQRVQPGGLTTYSPPSGHTQTPAPKSQPDPTKGAGNTVTQYSGLTIAGPANEEVVRSNEGNVTVKTLITPALDTGAGHQLVVLLDKKFSTKAPAAEALLKNVDRGTHTLRAQITDASGKVLAQSPEVTIHMQRGSQIKR